MTDVIHRHRLDGSSNDTIPLIQSHTEPTPSPGSRPSDMPYPSPKSIHTSLPNLDGPSPQPKTQHPRRDSFQTPFAFNHPHTSQTPRPPALRTAQSAAVIESYPHPHVSPATMMRTGSDPDRDLRDADRARVMDRDKDRERRYDEDKEELTTKGRKRKRLAKACSACHKNKRRCDGFAPCSNCEFSSRPCLYINAQGETIPPPRTRDSSVVPSARKEDKPDLGSGGKDEDEGGGEWARRGTGEDKGRPEDDGRAFNGRHPRPLPALSPVELVDRDPALSAELIDIFIRRVPPLHAILHLPTFHHRVYTSAASPLLLDAIYAFAARLCENPVFLATFPPNHPPWLRGEAFAERARLSIDRILESRRSWSEEDRRADRGTWEETEFIQSLCLLSTYGNCLRRNRQGLYYLDVGLSILRPDTPSGPLPPPSPHLHATLGTLEYLTLVEVRNRTFWLLILADLCAAANGRPRRLMNHEMSGVPLPGKEDFWNRYGGGGSTGEIGVRDGLIPGSGRGAVSWSAEESAVGELGQVLRILSIFCDIMTVANGVGSGSSDVRHIPAAQHEHALKSWALSLPPSLRFDEPNLCHHIAKLHSPLPQTSLTGWLYTYMHALAECGMFYLQAAVAPGSLSKGSGNGTSGPGVMAQRQNQAVENLAVILHNLGEKGREGPLMTFPTLVVSNWQDHIRSSGTPPTSSHSVLDDRISQWLMEMQREWGFERESIQDRGFQGFSSETSTRLHPSGTIHRFAHLLEPVQSPKGMTSTSSLGLYQNSSISLEGQSPRTPCSGGALTVSNLSYQNGGGGGGGGPGSSRYLPPLRPRASSSSNHFQSPTSHSVSHSHTKSPKDSHLPLLDRERERERERERDRGEGSRLSLPSLSSVELGRSYLPSPTKSGLGYFGKAEESGVGGRYGKLRSFSGDVWGSGAVGIQALVNAVEERQRERALEASG